MARSSTTWTPETRPKSPGRPPLEKSLTAALRAQLDPMDAARELIALTRCGDKQVRLAALRYLFDRLDGTPIQSLRTMDADLPRIVVRPRGISGAVEIRVERDPAEIVGNGRVISVESNNTSNPDLYDSQNPSEYGVKDGNDSSLMV